ncbi:MAG: DUF1049 domain-containing protein [Proteobacteria bacterium]|nr:DUF1049 domain-containing protein [Pseudomonadota bacterium]
MIRRIVALVVLLPIAAVAVALAVANRHVVTASFDPLLAGDARYALSLPFYMFAFAFLIAGIVLGGVATWLRQGRWRRAARQARAQVEALRREALASRQRAAEDAVAMPPRPALPRLVRPPAA